MPPVPSVLLALQRTEPYAVPEEAELQVPLDGYEPYDLRAFGGKELLDQADLRLQGIGAVAMAALGLDGGQDRFPAAEETIRRREAIQPHMSPAVVVVDEELRKRGEGSGL